MDKEYTQQEKQDIYLLKNISIKNIQISDLGCCVVVFEKTPQEVINFLKNKGFEHYKNGVYHNLINRELDFGYQIANRRSVYFSIRVNPDIITDLNLNHLRV